MIKVRIPTPLQKLTDNNVEVEAEGEDVRSLLSNLMEQYPELKERLYDNEGKLRKFINIYVNDEDIRFLRNEDTALKDGDVVSIIPAIAGG